jgi:hypothetical protein
MQRWFCLSLEVEIVCYFATKSIDEFLSLQQVRPRCLFSCNIYAPSHV